jgi:hypothetical protein
LCHQVLEGMVHGVSQLKQNNEEKKEMLAGIDY